MGSSPPGPVGFAPTYYPSSPDVEQAQRVRVQAGTDTPSVDIALRSARLARVSGQFVTASGALESGAHVTLLRPREGAAGLSPAVVTVAPVQRDRSFVFSGVPPGLVHARGPFAAGEHA